MPATCGMLNVLLLCIGAGDDKPAIDKIVEPLLKDTKCCIVVGVLKGGEQQVYGYGDAGPAGPPNGSTVFEIGSVTKVFTAAVLAQMVRDGKLKLDDPAQQYLPAELKLPRRGDHEITLEHLATHSSGLPRVPPLALHLLLNPQDAHNPYAHFGMKQLAGYLKNCMLSHDPGEVYEYSNLGVGILGLALAHKAGAANFEKLVIARVCDPLGMKDTCVTLSADQSKRLALGHDSNGKPTPGWEFEALGACGALRSTADDQLRFLAANLGKTPTPLTLALADCHEPRRDTGTKGIRVGLCWHTTSGPKSDKLEVWHNGGTGGYHSFIGFRKDNGTGVVVLCNSSALRGRLDSAAFAILRSLDAAR